MRYSKRITNAAVYALFVNIILSLLLLEAFDVSTVNNNNKVTQFPSRSKVTQQQQHQQVPRSCCHRIILHSSSTDGNDGGLTSALARIDTAWQIQQKSTSKAQNRWTKLLVSRNSDTVVEDNDDKNMEESDPVYLLEPKNNVRPSCMICFLGGAGLGTYPHIAYNELLLRVSDRLNAAVLTAPYSLNSGAGIGMEQLTAGLDHFRLAKQTGELTRKSILFCQDDPKRQYGSSSEEEGDDAVGTTMPRYALTHSLGGKLACIYAAATKDVEMYDGYGYMAFNNFGFGQTIGMVKDVAATVQKSTGMDNPVSGVSSDALDGLFNLAEMAVTASGIDFTPTAPETERLLANNYPHGSKTRLFAFDSDTLENTQEFCNAVSNAPSVSGLAGTHLTPVYFQFDTSDLPTEAQQVASTMGELQQISFGDEPELDELVNEICSWILGKEPTQRPAWLRERPQLSSSSSSTSS